MADSTRDLLAELTVEEKASLTSGADFWNTKAVERVGVPSMMLTDGPHGLRKQAGAGDHLGINDSVPATCFPPAVGLGSSFDPELAQRMGRAIGTEAAIEDVAVVLGPGINIKRSPLCGRNFEYFSEDPLVAGWMGGALVDGIQSRGVGSSLKHFAVNNQESDRMRVSADVDPRPLHEIYLRGFAHVVRQSQPWTVMCSYNKINGVYASENPWLLTDTLRTAWDFKAWLSPTGARSTSASPRWSPASIWRCRPAAASPTRRSWPPSATAPWIRPCSTPRPSAISSSSRRLSNGPRSPGRSTSTPITHSPAKLRGAASCC
ncbi:glycoside hydrolase family 3 protein [Gordonia alkaliphila]|uniref:glycoside hydrolase family 3 protein n=1 Tax=Gordonia alkaliphila TaxID=1053547 RepID=UPI0027E223D9|nr:glycoside hydrolase family 3 N-terminal domain-containing protein [Gordonia alkaliphila]